MYCIIKTLFGSLHIKRLKWKLLSHQKPLCLKRMITQYNYMKNFISCDSHASHNSHAPSHIRLVWTIDVWSFSTWSGQMEGLHAMCTSCEHWYSIQVIQIYWNRKGKQWFGLILRSVVHDPWSLRGPLTVHSCQAASALRPVSEPGPHPASQDRAKNKPRFINIRRTVCHSQRWALQFANTHTHTHRWPNTNRETLPRRRASPGNGWWASWRILVEQAEREKRVWTISFMTEKQCKASVLMTAMRTCKSDPCQLLWLFSGQKPYCVMNLKQKLHRIFKTIFQTRLIIFPRVSTE